MRNTSVAVRCCVLEFSAKNPFGFTEGTRSWLRWRWPRVFTIYRDILRVNGANFSIIWGIALIWINWHDSANCAAEARSNVLELQVRGRPVYRLPVVVAQVSFRCQKFYSVWPPRGHLFVSCLICPKFVFIETTILQTRPSQARRGLSRNIFSPVHNTTNF